MPEPLWRRVRAITPPAVTLVAILGLWSASIRIFHVPEYLLPTPSAVARALYDGYAGGAYLPHVAYTLESTLIGYVIGCASAFALGAIVAESPLFARFVYPYVVAAQSVPKVALAPLVIAWFGFDIASKVVMVVLICFFPVFVGTMVGIQETDPALIDLLRTLSASRSALFWRVKVPSAASHIFAGLEIAVVLSLIGAVVTEFVSSTRGLGYLIKAASANLQIDTVFAAALSLAALGLAGNLLVSWLHRRIVFWSPGAPPPPRG